MLRKVILGLIDLIFVRLVLFVSWVRQVLLSGQVVDAQRYNGPQSRLNWSWMILQQIDHRSARHPSQVLQCSDLTLNHKPLKLTETFHKYLAEKKSQKNGYIS